MLCYMLSHSSHYSPTFFPSSSPLLSFSLTSSSSHYSPTFFPSSSPLLSFSLTSSSSHYSPTFFPSSSPLPSFSLTSSSPLSSYPPSTPTYITLILGEVMIEVFDTAPSAKTWNYFTKGQRKSIFQWKEQTMVN